MDLFTHQTFRLFLDEIRPLGFVVSSVPFPQAEPYAVISARSNARWWLIPLADTRATASGLALFQPVTSTAKIAKATAAALATIHLSSLWARQRVYIASSPVFSELLGEEDLKYAFFTGTDCPHRKTTIQLMTAAGEIKGFAKVTLSAEIQKLLAREAGVLEYVRSLGLTSARIPHIRFRGEINGAEILVTDTEKTRHSYSPTIITQYHTRFLSELWAKSAIPLTPLAESQFLFDIRRQAEQYASRLPTRWNRRFSDAFMMIDRLAPVVKANMTFCHGDFTPWNAFMTNDSLYVFDWEYAHNSFPAGYDLIHFFLSLPETKRQPAVTTIRQLRKQLEDMGLTKDESDADLLFLSYLCGHVLQYIGRESHDAGDIMTWTGESETALFFDALSAGKR